MKQDPHFGVVLQQFEFIKVCIGKNGNLHNSIPAKCLPRRLQNDFRDDRTANKCEDKSMDLQIPDQVVCYLSPEIVMYFLRKCTSNP